MSARVLLVHSELQHVLQGSKHRACSLQVVIVMDEPAWPLGMDVDMHKVSTALTEVGFAL
jgi:hypothetical protein